MLENQVVPPEFTVDAVAPSRVEGADALALPVLAADGELTLGPGAAELLGETGLDVFALLDAERATGRAGEVWAMPIPAVGQSENQAAPSLLLLVGVGAGTPRELRRAGAALARRAMDLTTVATSVPAVGDETGLRAFVEGVVLGSFGFTMRSSGPKARPVARVVLAGAGVDQEALDRAQVIATAGWRSRTLATVPSNIKNPQWLVEQAEQVAADTGLKIKVWDEKALAKDGFGGILGVGAGSDSPPRLVRLEHAPKGATRHIVLVGKGITFDTGGLSIKPGELMVTMKRDMSGSGVVLAVLAALAELDVPVKVTGLLCLAENAIGGSAMRPGDVITHYGGRTTEVTNTDAEGRLVLADGLAYAVDKLKPDVLVDVATLTGAVKVALGQRIGGIFGNDDAIADDLISAGADAGEPLWRMPLSEVYEERLASTVADADNAPGTAQAITAALFLQHFVDGLPWAHLDLASVGDAVDDAYEWTPGPTGYGPRALLYWLERLAG